MTKESANTLITASTSPTYHNGPRHCLSRPWRGAVIASPPAVIFLLGGLLIAAVWMESVSAVGPDMQATAKLIKDLPAGIFAGEKLPPKDDRTLIEMSLNVRYLHLDYDLNKLTLSGTLTLKWKDERYKWDPTKYENKNSVLLPFSQDWAPDVMLHNSLENQFMYSKIGILENTGEIKYLVDIHTASACSPNFTDFPWGLQVCSLEFGSWINTQYQVEYRLPLNSTIGFEGYKSSKWKIVNSSSRLQSVYHPLAQEPAHLIVFDIAFINQISFDKPVQLYSRENRSTEL